MVIPIDSNLASASFQSCAVMSLSDAAETDRKKSNLVWALNGVLYRGAGVHKKLQKINKLMAYHFKKYINMTGDANKTHSEPITHLQQLCYILVWHEYDVHVHRSLIRDAVCAQSTNGQTFSVLWTVFFLLLLLSTGCIWAVPVWLRFILWRLKICYLKIWNVVKQYLSWIKLNIS